MANLTLYGCNVFQIDELITSAVKIKSFAIVNNDSATVENMTTLIHDCIVELKNRKKYMTMVEQSMEVINKYV